MQQLRDLPGRVAIPGQGGLHVIEPRSQDAVDEVRGTGRWPARYASSSASGRYCSTCNGVASASASRAKAAGVKNGLAPWLRARV